jgi:hypothetical protein
MGPQSLTIGQIRAHAMQWDGRLNERHKPEDRSCHGFWCTKYGSEATVSHEIRNRIVRNATPEENERHSAIRQEIQNDLPELKKWARKTAARHHERVAVGTVFTDQESIVLEAIDNYAAKHSLSSRGAVVREALAHLLGIEMPRL